MVTATIRIDGEIYAQFKIRAAQRRMKLKDAAEEAMAGWPQWPAGPAKPAPEKKRRAN